MRFLRLLGLLSVLIVILVACNSGDDELTVAQFPQTITSNTGELSVSYPEGWVALAGELSVNLANDQAVLDAGGSILDAGQIWGTIQFFPDSQIIALNLEANASPRDILDSMIDSNPVDVNINERHNFTVSGRRGIIARGTADNRGLLDGVVFALVKVNGGFIFCNFLTDREETEQFMDTVRSIATTLNYTPPATDG